MTLPPAWSAPEAARVIVDTYATYLAGLAEVIGRAKTHFEGRNWQGVQRDSAHRLDLYNTAVQEGLQRLRERLGPAMSEHSTWPRCARRTRR